MSQEWFVRRGEIERGPLSAQELKRLVEKGTIVASDMIRKSDQQEWSEAGKVRGLFPAESVARPVPPPLPSPTIDRPQQRGASPQPSMASKALKAEEQSSSTKGPLWQRLPLAVLLTFICWPVGMILVWLHPRLTRRTKTVWTGASVAAFLVIGLLGPKSNDSVKGVNTSTQRVIEAESSSRRASESPRTTVSSPDVPLDKMRDNDAALTAEYLTRKVGHVGEFTGKQMVGKTVVSHRIRETCTNASTIQCDGTESLFDFGSQVEGTVKGIREIKRQNGFVAMRGLYPLLLKGMDSDSSVAEYRILKIGAKPGDRWSDGKTEMTFVGFQDIDFEGRKERQAVIEGIDRDPSGQFDIRREFHLQKGVGIVFYRQSVGAALSHEYMLAGSSGNSSAQPPSAVPSDPLETVNDFGLVEMYSTTRIPVFQTVPADILKLVPKEQHELATKVEALCSRAEKQIAAANNPAMVASIEAAVRREHAALVQGYSANPLPTLPIKGWVGQIRFDENRNHEFTIVLGRMTQVQEHPDPRKGMLYFSSIYDKAFMLHFSIKGAKKDLLDDIAPLKNGDWVKCDMPDYATNNLMSVSFQDTGNRTLVVHDLFSARANAYSEACPRISKIRSK